VQPERDFAAWLDRRDADALARVFDATGGRLLLLAAHLAGSGEQAQDLVQATFVAAMARGASWDRARPLWPWLAAILHNELLMERRRGRRRREVDLAAAHDAASAAPGPQQVAASEEAFAAVLGAIDALPLPYRQVLRLRLVHGLRPVDIARSLEVPVGTVRAQLHRGLEQLRSALPAGVAGVLALLSVGDDALLAQVRERVLEHAAAMAPATGAVATWSLLGGWLSMKGKTIAVVVAAGAVLACLSFAFGVPAWSGGLPRPAEPPSPARGEMAAADAGTPPSASEPRREPVAAAAAAVWPLEVTVREKGGAPIAGARVEVWTAPTCLMIANQEHGAFGRQDVAAGETGADGVFRTRLDALRDRSALFRRTNLLWIRARWPHGCAREQLLGLPRGTDGESFKVTIELSRRRVLTGVVVDGGGAAVAGAKVMMVAPSTDLFYAELYDRVLTDGDGVFTVEPGEDEEQWPLQLAVADACLGTATVAVPPRPDAVSALHLGTIVLQANDRVCGSVVLGDGLPLAHTSVAIDAIDPQLAGDVEKALARRLGRNPAGLGRSEGRLVWQHARTNTRADGAFAFAGLDPAATYAVHVDVIQGLLRASAVAVRPGGGPVQLRVDAQLLTIEPRGDGGELLPGIRLWAEAWDPKRQFRAPQPRPGFPETGYRVGNVQFAADPDGRLALLSPFGWVWRVATSDDVAEPAVLRHDVLPGVHRATRTLELRAETRFGRLHVVAVDEHGAPLQNWGATLRAVDRDLQQNDSRMVAPPGGRTWDLPAGAWDLHVLLGREAMYSPELDSYVRGYHDQRVTVEDGRTTEVKVVAEPAGQIAFRPALPPAGRGKRARIQEGGRDVEITALYRDVRKSSEYSTDGTPVLYVTRQALAPGPHAFVVLVEGCQSATVRVDVVADRLADVDVELQPL
jgi:RNA polymerase sigma-70 factor (ECF subfamily)